MVSVMLISLRVIAATKGRPNFLIILTDDQDVVLNGMVRLQNGNNKSTFYRVLGLFLFVDANGKDSTVVS